MSDASEIKRLLSGLKSMSHDDMAATLALLDELETRKRINLAQADFLAFIAAVDTGYKFGTHLKKLGALLMQVENDERDRVAVSMAPRFGKSQMISIYYPAWYLGKHPDHKMIVASHTVDLAVDMARKVRNLMQTPEYKRIFRVCRSQQMLKQRESGTRPRAGRFMPQVWVVRWLVGVPISSWWMIRSRNRT